MQFLTSLRAYFLWDYLYVVPALVTVYTFFFYMNCPSFFSFNRKCVVFPSLLLSMAMLYTIRSSNLNGYIGQLFTLIPIFFVFSLITDVKAEILVFLTKAFSVLLLISVTAWILFLLGVSLPSSEISYNDGQYYYSNFYLFLENKIGVTIFPRFSSVFLEPGYISLLIILFLYLNEFRVMRWDGAVLFVSLILTFSLAGYLVFIISYVAYQLRNSKMALIYLSLMGLLGFAGHAFFTTYAGGNNPVNQLIFTRLAVEDGKIVGYNRTKDWFDEYYKRFMKSDDVFFGVGVDAIDLESNVGYKAYLVLHGVFGLALLVAAFASPLKFNRTYNAFILFMLYVIIFMRGHHIIYWFGFLLIYACAISLPRNWREVYENKSALYRA